MASEKVISTRRTLKKEAPTTVLDDVLDQTSDPESTEVPKSVGLLCALSIPESGCPSPHEDFLKKYSKDKKVKASEIDKVKEVFTKNKRNLNITPSEIRTRSQRKSDEKLDLTKVAYFPDEINTTNLNLTETASPVKTQGNKVNKSEEPTPCSSKSIPEQTKLVVSNKSSDLPKENMPKPSQSKFKHWFEDDKPTVEKVGRNKLMINGTMVVVNYNKYIKEADVIIDYEVDEVDLRPLPGYCGPCEKEFCRLGCVCQSIAQKEIIRSRCQNFNCMFGCICFPSTNINNDGDIRSRLRPRVSLLNWKRSDATYKYTLASYKRLEKNRPAPLGNAAGRSFSRLRNQNNQNIIHGVQYRKRNAPRFGSMSINGSKKFGSDGNQRMTNGRNKKIIEINSKPSNVDQVSPLGDEHRNNNNTEPKSGSEINGVCQPSDEDEYPTILYQKIGTTPLIESEFLQSCVAAITSYGDIKRVLENVQMRDTIKRQDGKTIFISWTISEAYPYVSKKGTTEDQLVLPILPEKSEWLIYELQFEEHCSRSSCISFTDIGLIFFKRFLMFQKIQAEKLRKVVKLKLQHHEIRNSKSTMSMYVLPRLGNLVVLGPVKKSLRQTTNVTFVQALSFMEDIQEKKYFGSSHFWDFSYNVNQNNLAESFHHRIQRVKNDEDDESEVMTNKIVGPEIMEQIIPELMETYEEDEVPTSFRISHNHNQRRNLIQLKWSDSMKCSANLHPQVQTVRNATRLKIVEDKPLDNETIDSPNEQDTVDCKEFHDDEVPDYKEWVEGLF